MKTGSWKQNERLVIGLDCSTTSIKAIAFDRKGCEIAFAQEAIQIYSPKPHQYEQDPNEWWTSTQKVLAKITRFYVIPR